MSALVLLLRLSNFPLLSPPRSLAGFGFRMRTPVLVPRAFLLVAVFLYPVSPEDCCLTKTVRDATGEDSKLNGVYTLKANEDSKPDPNCIDGCVYMKDNEEYCFIEKSGATVDCEVRDVLRKNRTYWGKF